MSVLDVLVSLSPALLGALLGLLCTRGYGRWTKAAAARDKARDELDEIMRRRWWHNPSTQGDREDRTAVQLYDEHLPSDLCAAGVPEELISQLRDELDALRRHVQTDGDDETSSVENMDLDRLYEVVDDIHIWLNEADRRHRASQPASIGSRGTKSDHKSLTGTPA
ncbi:MAG TPA: hypothetical protein VE823_16645 [Geodermatophilus sp.]|nr:hypothetical protein [Geodermatophilus sp.]